MQTHFYDYTFDLTDTERKVIMPHIVEVITQHVGKVNAISGAKIQEYLLQQGHKVRPYRVRKIIGQIRREHIVKNVCSTNVGYYVASNVAELEEAVESLHDRLAAQFSTFQALAKDLSEMKGEKHDEKQLQIIL